jgi:hypothetical protein
MYSIIFKMSKNRFNMRRLICQVSAVLGLLGFFIFPACKKVDEHSQLVASQPWLADNFSSTRLPGWYYPTNVSVGDTVTLVGRLFPYQQGSVITVGNIPVKIIDTAEIPPNYTTYNQQAPVDVVRFLITEDMGAGPNRPVTVTANGITIQGHTINIAYYSASAARTDTTLWVDQIAAWLPDYATAYNNNGNGLFRSAHVVATGDIYFDNPDGIYKLSAGQVTNILRSGNSFTDDNNSQFSIKAVLGSAITYDGATLYFSGEVSENTTDTVQNYLFRVCKMDMNTKKVTTINRTLVFRYFQTTEETGLRYEGPLAQLKVVARNLNVTLNGEFYYTNYYAPGSAVIDHSFWHDAPGGVVSGALDYDIIYASLVMVCRMDNTGKVNVLLTYFDGGQPYVTPGLHVRSGVYMVDPNAKYIYGYVEPDNNNYDLAQFDIQEQYELAMFKNGYQDQSFAFRSFETNPAYRSTTPIGLSTADPYSYGNTLPILDGSILGAYTSLVDYDLIHKSAYCYAGTEIATYFQNPVPAQQNQLTGLAKWVNFSSAVLLGQDRSGAVYYCTGLSDYVNGVVFYKLYPKK